MSVFIIGDLCKILFYFFLFYEGFHSLLHFCYAVCILSVESSGESSRGECSCESYEFTIDTCIQCLMSSMGSCVSSMRSLTSWITIDTFGERGECSSDLSH